MRQKTNTIRSFFAIEMPLEVRHMLYDLTKRLKKRSHGDQVKWVSEEKIHLTLRFIGKATNEQVESLKKRIQGSIGAFKPFSLEFDSLDFFPTRRNARVIVMRLKPSKMLNELVSMIETHVIRAGFPPEKRQFKSHITLGRIRGHIFPEIDENIQLPIKTFEVFEMTYFESKMDSRGSIYYPLCKWTLKETGNEKGLG